MLLGFELRWAIARLTKNFGVSAGTDAATVHVLSCVVVIWHMVVAASWVWFIQQ